jgi:hypothetical protein
MNDLFGKKPRAPIVRRMHMVDVGYSSTNRREDLDNPIARFERQRCGAETDWLMCKNATEVRRGIPCETCNEK